MSLLEAVRRANEPGPPENSVRLRVACLGAALVAIAACASLGEIGWTTAVGAMALVTAGMVFAHATRARPPGWVKVSVAVGAIAACVWFFHVVSAPLADFSSVVNPLTVLLVAVLVVHSFHVPSRRDLLFSLGASAGLMAVGGAQAIDLRFGLYVVAWACCSVWGLTEMWTSASGGGRISASSLVLALAATSTAAAAVFLVLPAPVVSSRVSFISRAGAGGSVGVPGAFAGDSGVAAQLSRSGSPANRIRVGGYLGFAGSLNTALRGKLGNTLVMQVRAQRPSYWVGETFDTWQGGSWTESQPVPRRPLRQSSPFVLPVSLGEVPLGRSDLQTFYVASPTANLVFHAESADELWFPAGKVYVAEDGTIVSPLGLGSGSIYTVDSQVSTATPAQLRSDDSPLSLPPDTLRHEEQLPHPYPRVLCVGRIGHRRRPDDLRQGAVAHRLDRDAHPLLAGHPATARGRRHRRRVPLRQPGRFLRADLDLSGRDAALPRHPRPRGGRVRARGLQPDHRPLPGPRQRRPRLGPGVVPRLRMAGLRPHGGGAARRAQPGRDRTAGRRCGPPPHPSGAGGPRAGGHRVGGRRGALAPSTPGLVGGGGGAEHGARRTPRRTAAPARRDVVAVRRQADELTARRGERRRHLEPTGLVGGGECLRGPRSPPETQRAMAGEARRTRVRRRAEAISDSGAPVGVGAGDRD